MTTSSENKDAGIPRKTVKIGSHLRMATGKGHSVLIIGVGGIRPPGKRSPEKPPEKKK